MTNGYVSLTDSPKVRAPDPKPTQGISDARELDNFLWQMERHFEAMVINDEKAKVRTATMYLTDTAALWWRRRYTDIEKGRCG